MAAYRLLDTEGQVIGSVILDRKALEDELVGGLPELKLGYTTTLTNVVSFILEVVPPGADDGS